MTFLLISRFYPIVRSRCFGPMVRPTLAFAQDRRTGPTRRPQTTAKKNTHLQLLRPFRREETNADKSLVEHGVSKNWIVDF